MAHCPKCQSYGPSDALFCPTCGHPLAEPAPARVSCPFCKKIYPPDAVYCIDDGCRLVYPGAVAELDAIPGLPYSKAPLDSRFFACLLDGLVEAAACLPAFLLFKSGITSWENDHTDSATIRFFFALLFYLAALGYGLLKDGLGRGQSWGKKQLHLMVVNLDDDSPCNTRKSFLRNLVSALLAMVPFIGWLAEPVLVLGTKDGRRLGDYAANTQVIELKQYRNA